MLFENKERVRTTPMRRGEREFDFYDSSALPPFATYRTILNEWVYELPVCDRNEIISRFKKGGNAEFEATLAELVVHAALRRGGYLIDVHFGRDGAAGTGDPIPRAGPSSAHSCATSRGGHSQC